VTKTIFNKKRIKKSFILKIISSLFILILFFFFSYKFFSFNYYKYFFNGINSLSKDYNYLFSEIKINGLNNLSSDEIEKYFIKYYNKSIFLLPLKNISKEIKMNKWIESVSLRSNFKNKVFIVIKEAKPTGIYFNGKNYLLINNIGKVIDFIDESKTHQYIIFFGENAKENVANLIMKIPFSLQTLIKKAEYISERRWDIILKNNIKIKLPEFEIKEAFEHFIEIYDNISNQDKSIIKSIDLRLPKKVIIKFNE